MPGLKSGDRGSEVKALQRALNERAQARFYPPLVADGAFGPATRNAFEAIGYALGFTSQTLASAEISVEAQKLILEPGGRTAPQLARARQRQAKLGERTISFDGVPVFWGLAKPLLRARETGWQGKLRSADRRKGVAERFGKKSQAVLFDCFSKRRQTGLCPAACAGDCNPANPPGFSSHELRSDAAAFKGPRGRALRWWELGLDVERSEELLQELRALGCKVRRPYSSPSEFHHVNFTAAPGPVIEAGTATAPVRRPAKPRKPARPAGEVKTLTGPDVSMHQGDVDWKKVKQAGHDFAFVKATEGMDFTDKNFGKGRWKALKDAGLVRGAYHFARPQPGRDPAVEVAHFVNTVKAAGGFRKGDLRPVLDLEVSKNLSAAQVLEWARGFVRGVESRVGARPIIYTGSFWRDAMRNPADDLGCPLWLAAYVKDPDPFIPRAWRNEGYVIWQHTDRGSVPGIKGGCDLNRFRGTDKQFARLRLAS